MAIFPPIRKSTSYLLALSFFLSALGVYCLLHPLVLSNDSIYGFLAYNGTLESGSFNVVTRVAAANINLIEKHFVAWWSPGQWLFPGILTYLFGFKFGIASIVVTVFFGILGLVGYAKLFDYFKFPLPVKILSLVIIFSSSTFYYSFIIYQGGEILEFGVFPWFLLYVLKIRKINIYTLCLLTAGFFLCFVAKITLALYCTIILLYKVSQISFDRMLTTRKLTLAKDALLCLVPIFICLPIIYFFFLSRGARIAIYDHPALSIEAFLVPLASPLISILSIQQWISRIEKFVALQQGSYHVSHALAILLYIAATLSVFLAGWSIYRNKKIDPTYKNLLLFTYFAAASAFIILYLLGATISLNSRHLKLLGYLSIPGLLTVLQSRLKYAHLHVIFLLFLIAAFFDFRYLKQKWTANRYVSIHHFYRGFDNLETMDHLDQTTYRQLIDLDRSNHFEKRSIFFIEANDDIGIDLNHQCISQRPENNLFQKPYLGKGPTLLICISRNTLALHPNFLKRKFPGYCDFESINAQGNYLFFVANTPVTCNSLFF